MARPTWKPTAKERETVKLMTGYGIPQNAICAVLKTTKPILEKHCRHELDTGPADANAIVAASMFRMPTKGPYSVRFQAAKYWLACRANWRETASLRDHQVGRRHQRQRVPGPPPAGRPRPAA